MRNRKVKFNLTLLFVFAAGMASSVYGPKLSNHLTNPNASSRLYWVYSLTEWCLRELLPRIGEAMTIAPILAILVDEAAKQNLLADFARDVSVHIIGRYLPRELREHISGYLTVDIVRLDLDVVYTITETPNGLGVELETVMTSDLHNYSFKDINSEIFLGVSKSLNPAIGNTIITEVSAGDFTYRHGDDLQSHKGKLTSTNSGEEFRTSVPLPASHAGTIPHGTRCIVKSKEYFPLNGQNPWLAVYPVIGATVTVVRPDTFDTSLELTFTQGESVPDVMTELRFPGRCRWKIKTPILQGQGFFLKWSKGEQRFDAATTPSVATDC